MQNSKTKVGKTESYIWRHKYIDSCVSIYLLPPSKSTLFSPSPHDVVANPKPKHQKSHKSLIKLHKLVKLGSPNIFKEVCSL
jgi:hypothetical protein